MKKWCGLVEGLAVVLVLVGAARAQDRNTAAVVLGEESRWRYAAVYDLADPSRLPAPEWRSAAFDDRGWRRGRGAILGGYGDAKKAGVALVCARSRFAVRDPQAVKGLRLAVRYRGGLIVFVNGREIARGHLPGGVVEPGTPAAPYPPEVFLSRTGRTLLRDLYGKKPPAALADRYEGRIRSIEASIPASLLVAGTNVLALELHRSPIPASVRKVRNFRETWNTAGLVGIRLSAEAGIAATSGEPSPRGALVWNADPLLRVGVDIDAGDPLEELGPVTLDAPRNGFASGQVVVSSARPLGRLAAAVSDLASPEGGTIPAARLRVRYARPGAGFVPLFDEPPAGASVQPIWITAHVPPTARPGTYRGELSVTGLAEPVPVPVELTVYGWKVGDPRQWRTSVNLLQSPESVAGQYGVPLWSDRHFRLMERSFALMGGCGNDVLGISAVAASVFGNDPLIVFRREAGQYVPDFALLDRYLALYDRHAGAPQFLAVNIWSYGMYKNAMTRDGGTEQWRASVIPVMERRGDAQVSVEIPIYGEPGTERLWRSVMDGVRERVARMGWDRTRLLVGTSGDAWPSRITVNLFKTVAPDVKWRVLTHGGGAPKWGISDHERTQPNGMVVGYLEIARRLTNRRVKLPAHPVSCNARDKVGADPFTYRGLAFVNTIATNYDGYCWKGIDYWTYTTAEGTERNALNTYVHFGNMVGGTPRAIAAPGPDGAVATVQYEMLRQGTQECEAALAIRESLSALYPPRETVYDVVNLTLEGALLQAGNRKNGKQPRVSPRDLELKLVYDRGSLRPEPVVWAPTYNHGTHTGTLVRRASPTGQVFAVTVQLGDDPWVTGGPGAWILTLDREGDVFTGTFAGSFKGTKTEGRVTGVFTPKGYRVPAGTEPEPSPLARRCEAAIGDLARLYERGRGGSGARPGELRRLVRRLYATATEGAAAVEGMGR
jgi:hypothetical protein